mgnify:CR=1 FL=1
MAKREAVGEGGGGNFACKRISEALQGGETGLGGATGDLEAAAAADQSGADSLF